MSGVVALLTAVQHYSIGALEFAFNLEVEFSKHQQSLHCQQADQGAFADDLGFLHHSLASTSDIMTFQVGICLLA